MYLLSVIISYFLKAEAWRRLRLSVHGGSVGLHGDEKTGGIAGLGFRV